MNNKRMKDDFLDTLMDFKKVDITYKWWSHVLMPIICCAASIIVICYLIRRSQLKVRKMMDPFVHTSHCKFSIYCERAVQVNLLACILL